MQHALSYYRLTAAFRETVEQALGPVTDWVFMGDLRNRGLRGMMSSLRAVRGETLLVCIENDNGRPLATPLALAAFASRCRKIKIVWPDGRVEAVSRWRLFPMIWKLMAAQVQSRRAFRRVQRLAARPVQPASEFRTQRDAAGGLFVDANLSFGVTAGGSVGHIQGVLNGFVRQGHPMDYASIKAPPPGATDVGWKTLPTPGMLAFPAELNYYTHHAVADRSLRRSAEAKAYRFVYQRLSLHNLSGTVLADRFGLPLVVEYNGSEAWAAEKWGTRLSLHDAAVATEHATMRRADLVVTISAPLRDEALALGVSADRIVTYPNCVDLALFAPSRFPEDAREALRDRLGIAQNARVGTFIGTFGAWHGIEFLAAGIRRLIDEDRAYVDANWLHFLLIGDGLKMAEVKALIGDPPYAGYVTLTGLVPQPDAPHYLAISDYFLSPHVPTPDGSVFFGSPTKLFEYMAMGRAIVASRLAQIGDILEGRGPFGEDPPSVAPLAALFEPGDQDGMLTALRQVIDDPVEAEGMAIRSMKEVEARYTWDHHVSEILQGMQRCGLLDGEP